MSDFTLTLASNENGVKFLSDFLKEKNPQAAEYIEWIGKIDDGIEITLKNGITVRLDLRIDRNG